MNASRTDQPRTSPVAFRTKSVRSSYGRPPAMVVIAPLLTARQDELLDLLLAVELDDGAEELALLVRAPRVVAERVAEPRRPAGLVDVPVQREARLELLDHLTDGGRADGPRRPTGVLEVHVGGELRRLVELGVVRRAVQRVDGSLRGRGH